MKLSIFPKFGALNSKSVFESFKEGAESLGHQVTEHDTTADVFVIWSVLWNGRMKNNQALWELAKNTGKKVIVLEVGGLKRGITWKVGLGGINNLAYFGNKSDLIPNRSKKLGIELKPWNESGKHVLICAQHSLSEQWIGRESPEKWALTTIRDIKMYSNRPIILRPHPRDFSWAKNIKDSSIKIKIPQQIPNTYDDFDFESDLKTSWCVINPTSNTGIQSIIAGVPAFVENQSLAWEVANYNFSQIESPLRPDREKWLEELCHTEWTLDEIRLGLPLNRIFK